MLRRAFLFTMSLPLFFSWSCHEKVKGTFTVSGTYKNAEKLAGLEGPVSKVYLLETKHLQTQPQTLVLGEGNLKRQQQEAEPSVPTESLHSAV